MLFAAAAGARLVTADFRSAAHQRHAVMMVVMTVVMIAMRPVHVAVRLVIVVAIRAVHVGLACSDGAVLHGLACASGASWKTSRTAGPRIGFAEPGTCEAACPAR